MKKQYSICPICGHHKFSSSESAYLICPHCGWVHDLVDEDETNAIHGPNELPLREFKLQYEHYLEHNPNYHWKRDGFPEE